MRAPGLSLFRGARGAAALLGLSLVFAGLPGAAASASTFPAAGSGVSTEATVADTPALTVSLTAANAGVLAPGQELTVSVTVTNSSNGTVSPGNVELWLDPSRQKSRSALTSWLSSTDAVANTVTIGRAAVPLLEPGTSTVVQVQVPAASVPFATSITEAVYGLGASIDAGDAETVSARGSVVWNPGSSAPPSTVGVVMPVISPSTSGGLLSADDLTTFTGPNGVLTRELDGLAKHSSVAIGIDPMIIASVRALGNAAPESATAWLDRLSHLPNDIFPLAFGDADVAGQIQSGLSAPLAPTSLAYALDPKNFSPTPSPVGEPTATPTPTATPGATPSPTPTTGTGPVLPTLAELVSWKYTLHGIAWPGDDTVRTADLAPLVAAGLTTTIVSSSNTSAKRLSGTANAALPFSRGKLAVADAGLSDAIRQAASAPSAVAWNTAMSKVNAQLELTAQEGGDAKHLLVSFDRSWPSSGTQLGNTLDALLGSPWSSAATLPETLAGASTAGLTLTDAAETDSRIDTIKRLLAEEKSLADFSTVLDDPTTLTGSTRAEILTLLAVSWQNPRNDWDAAVAEFSKTTTGTLSSIRIVPTENVNLVSAQGSIPFTVVNDLKNEAANLVLTALPSNSRLEIDEDATKRLLPDSRATMLVPVKAKLGNGQVVLTLHLFSPTGVEIGYPSTVTVDVHADWEGIGALIFGILLVLLFGFGIVRNILRRRDQRRNGGTVESDDKTDAPAEADAPRDTDTVVDTDADASASASAGTGEDDPRG
ncbi:DUF6049 family protein [Leifsonia poae]|uniref:DUF6049 family protein n=1 Tax=Leifsonia poae TaxID=110933 RepID=UPI001CC19100|nr:DUF6049 family protein [Leifsonia poae]